MNEKFSWGWYRLQENQISQTDQCQITDHALSTVKCKQWVVKAFECLENKDFDEVC